jgi:predicted ArsR family transcriptional regulator
MEARFADHVSPAVKCGPENCPLTAWAALSPSERKIQRQALAEQLYRQGFTMEQIAKQFGVNKAQISRDLANCCDVQQLNPAKSETNPKGAGRPKGSRRESTRGQVTQKLVS